MPAVVAHDELARSGPAELLLVFALPGAALGIACHELGTSLGGHVAAGRGAAVVAGLAAIVLVPLLFWFTTAAGHRIAALLFAVLTGGLLALGIGWSVQRYGFDGRVEVPAGRSLALALFAAFVIAPFFGAVRASGDEPPYAGLFKRAWNQTVIGLVAVLSCAAVLLLNALVVTLFDLVEIGLEGWLYDERWLAGVAGGALAGAIGLAREHERVVQALRGLLIALVQALLPVHLLVVVVFLVAVALRGPGVLDAGLSVTAVLLLVAALAATFVAAALGDAVDPVAPRWRRFAVRLLAVLVLPLSLLAGWTLWLRIGEYGLTAERVLAAVLVLFATGYGIGYALAAFRPDVESVLARTNTAMALLGALVAAAMLTPPGDPVGLAVRDQLARATRDGADAGRIDLAWFAFDTGRAGRAALERIRALPAADEPPLATRLAVLDDSGGAFAFRERDGVFDADERAVRREHERLTEALAGGAVRVIVREGGRTRRFDPVSGLDFATDSTRRVVPPTSAAGITDLLLASDRSSPFVAGCGSWQESCTVIVSDEPTLVPGALTALMVARHADQPGTGPAGLSNLSWYVAREGEPWTLLDAGVPPSLPVEPERLDRWFAELDSGTLALVPVRVLGLQIGGALLLPDGQSPLDPGDP